MTPGQTIREMQMSESHWNVSRTLIYKWHKRFSTGWKAESTNSKGRPAKIKKAMVQQVSDVIKTDRRQTVREIADVVDISKSSVQRILSENLSMSRVCARWVPRLLTEEQMERRVTDSRYFLRQCKRDKNFLSKIVTMDESWIHYYEPESKRQSSVWKSPNTPPPKKAKVVKSMGKVMLMVFLDIDGVLLAHAVRPHATVNAAYYSQVIRRDLMRAIRKKRPGMAEDLENVVYHHDNAPPHTAASTELEMALLGFQRLPHPPYSPDLAPLDFAYFPALKDYLRGTKFDNVDEIQLAVRYYNRSLKPQWFRDVFAAWVRRHQKCIEHHGDYFEKNK